MDQKWCQRDSSSEAVRLWGDKSKPLQTISWSDPINIMRTWLERGSKSSSHQWVEMRIWCQRQNQLMENEDIRHRILSGSYVKPYWLQGGPFLKIHCLALARLFTLASRKWFIWRYEDSFLSTAHSMVLNRNVKTERANISRVKRVFLKQKYDS